MNTLGYRIKQARGKVSQDAFAARLHISKGSLGFYERDENLPNTNVILKICSETGVSLEWLMTGTGPMRSGDAPVHIHEAPSTPSEPLPQSACPRCAKLETTLEEERSERRELATENRRLWKENGELREKVARLEGELNKRGINQVPFADVGGAG